MLQWPLLPRLDGFTLARSSSSRVAGYYVFSHSHQRSSAVVEPAKHERSQLRRLASANPNRWKGPESSPGFSCLLLMFVRARKAVQQNASPWALTLPDERIIYCPVAGDSLRSLVPQLITTSKPRSGRKRIRASDAHSFSMRLLLALLLSHAAAEVPLNRCVDSDTWHKRGDPKKDCKSHGV